MKTTLSLAISALAAPAALAQLSFQPLGLTPGGQSSMALAISADAGTVAGGEESPFSSRAWYWRQTTGITIISGATAGRKVSADGALIIGVVGGTGGSSFRYSVPTNTIFILPPVGAVGMEGYGGSDDGMFIVGRVFNVHSSNPEKWREGQGFSEFPYAPNTDTGIAYAATPDGTIAVGEMDSFANGSGTAFRWTTAGTVALGTLPPGGIFAHSGAYDVNPDGSFIVGYSTSASGLHPFRWTQAQGMQDLGVPNPASQGGALGVSSDGSVVVGHYTRDNIRHALIWDQAHGARDLQFVLEQQGSSGAILGWTLSEATDVSADGQTIVGYGLDPQGRTQAFLARITAAPCYPNCDSSTSPPVLNVLDFNCFLNRFTAGDSWANCDDSTAPPMLNVLDFNCFIARFTLGC